MFAGTIEQQIFLFAPCQQRTPHMVHVTVWQTRKSCSETNTKAALRYRSTTILKLFAPKS